MHHTSRTHTSEAWMHQTRMHVKRVNYEAQGLHGMFDDKFETNCQSNTNHLIRSYLPDLSWMKNMLRRINWNSCGTNEAKETCNAGVHHNCDI